MYKKIAYMHSVHKNHYLIGTGVTDTWNSSHVLLIVPYFNNPHCILKQTNWGDNGEIFNSTCLLEMIYNNNKERTNKKKQKKSVSQQTDNSMR